MSDIKGYDRHVDRLQMAEYQNDPPCPSNACDCPDCVAQREEADYYAEIDRRIDERQDPNWDDERTGQ